jgi:hypothetical protein
MQLRQLGVTVSSFLANSLAVKIVTGIDDHSRYCVIATTVMRAAPGRCAKTASGQEQ